MSTPPESPWLADLRSQVVERLRAQKATQAGLAEYLKVSPKHVNQILKGRNGATPEMLDRIAAAVGLEIVVRDSGQPPAPLAKHRGTLAGQRQRIAAAILAEQVRCLVHGEDFATHPGCTPCDRNAALELAASHASAETPGGSR